MVSSGCTSSVNVRSSRVRTKICIAPTNGFYLQGNIDQPLHESFNRAGRMRIGLWKVRCVFLLQLFLSSFFHYLSSIGGDRPISSRPLIEIFLRQKQISLIFLIEKFGFFADLNGIEAIWISSCSCKTAMHLNETKDTWRLVHFESQLDQSQTCISHTSSRSIHVSCFTSCGHG